MENAEALEHDLTVFSDLNVNVISRLADRIGLNLAIRLDRHEHAGFSHAVELFQVEADATIELEDIRSNRLACRIPEPHLAETERVCQRSMDTNIAQGIDQPRTQRNLFPVKGLQSVFFRVIHTIAEQLPLYRTRIFDADHHCGQQVLEYTRR